MEKKMWEDFYYVLGFGLCLGLYGTLGTSPFEDSSSFFCSNTDNGINTKLAT